MISLTSLNVMGHQKKMVTKKCQTLPDQINKSERKKLFCWLVFTLRQVVSCLITQPSHAMTSY